jgi:predicted RNase H-like HicB family nuclease
LSGVILKSSLCYNMLMKAIDATIYPAVFNPIPDGGYEVSFPDFPGCVTFGDTFEEAQNKASEVLSLWIEELEDEHVVIPKHTQRPIITDVKVAFA